MNDHLKTARSITNEDGSPVTECSLLASDESVREIWNDIQIIKREIAEAKHQACRKIDEEYRDRLNELVSNYAILLTFMR